ncbi:hypothetical protein [Methylobacterium haplocladii]|uniref:Uncharacterized protein n=1 Tax=Methylobacterium haplocladii TaxID=1176176 RepID=A0A512ISA0_9HYPH|nr:hypothetical protein [Methylobacterium haplocladii]GEP00580.1 hypothetical protein MHA02_29670 [Methylobacterium haplocladii]GJD85495.1 hypothetical protein HPGCJGGD_3384 [Methylobacterium haplocladii]GLS57728.1 hypothetical protein GCM10007887_03840 [Methylobacterium haplocladii]
MSIPARAAEQAVTVSVARCPCGLCDHVIGLLHDETGEVFAEFSLAPDAARGFIADVQTVLDALPPVGSLTGIRCEGTA